MRESPSPVPRTQEVAVWWGGYSPWTMIPSLLACFALTAAIVWWSWAFVERRYVQLAILGMASLVWIVQSTRFIHRVFGSNYHVTTRRLVHEKGVLFKKLRLVSLDDVASVEVERGPLDELLGVGRIVFRLKDSSQPPVVWRGVRQSRQIADRVRILLQAPQPREQPLINTDPPNA